MHFNKLDICDAYHLYASLYNNGQGSKEYKIFGRLQKLEYRPRYNHTYANLSENAKDIYNNLVKKRNKHELR